ncbi:hypothetical protein BAGQ_3433 [Bacillus velezensis]|nr:hypothetical protein BCBMB205_32940 [Bacillus velezensis]ARZ59638.1 hypothetical protein BAGQ_3433 [Bacillus velezensis]
MNIISFTYFPHKKSPSLQTDQYAFFFLSAMRGSYQKTGVCFFIGHSQGYKRL